MKPGPAIAHPIEHIKPFVLETPIARSLHFSITEVQSRMSLRDPDRLELEYTRLMMGFVLFDSAPADIGLVGFGGGSLAKFCHRHLPRSRMAAVEINPHVIALRDEFAVPPDDTRLRVAERCGAEFVAAHANAFDVLLVDGYDSGGVPDRLCSPGFYDDCLRALRPDGLLVANLHLDDPQYRTHLARIGQSFGRPALAVGGNDCGNSVAFAAKGATIDRFPIGPMKRPEHLAAEAWKQLGPACSRVVTALREQRGSAAPARVPQSSR